jgi:ribonuclease P protein component
VLPAFSRVRSRSEHRLVAARGRRARRGQLVVHVLVQDSTSRDPDAGSRAGVVVGKRVGNAVTRNLVKRRLRELLRARLAGLPAGTLVVVRALPGAGEQNYVALGGALEAALLGATDRPRPAAMSS